MVGGKWRATPSTRRGRRSRVTSVASAVGRPEAISAKPRLVFFHSAQSGSCRRAEGFLAQVLQRRRNHGTFKLYRVAREERPDLAERFGVVELPTLFVVERKQVRAKVE